MNNLSREQKIELIKKFLGGKADISDLLSGGDQTWKVIMNLDPTEEQRKEFQKKRMNPKPGNYYVTLNI